MKLRWNVSASLCVLAVALLLVMNSMGSAQRPKGQLLP